MAACTDFGLSAAFLQALAEQYGDEYGKTAAERTMPGLILRRAADARRRNAVTARVVSGVAGTPSGVRM